MEFGWINLFGAVIVVMVLIPNIIYAFMNKGQKNLCTDRFMNVLEQIGRYACIILMWLPAPVRKFGFASVQEMLFYLFGNGALLVVYWIVYTIYMIGRNERLTTVLAAVPACIFFLSGLLLRHWLLCCFAVLFAVSHIWVTKKNTLKD